MRKADALAFFDDNQAELARALDITRATVCNWPDVIPHDKARAIEILTRGKVRIDESLYPSIKRAREIVSHRQS